MLMSQSALAVVCQPSVVIACRNTTIEGEEMSDDVMKLARECVRHTGQKGEVVIMNSDALEAFATVIRSERASALPPEPPPGLLMSMAIRYDYGLGVPGHYDQLLLPAEGSHAARLAATLRTMRQLYDEVAGRGFYSKDKEAEYAALATEQAVVLTPCAYRVNGSGIQIVEALQRDGSTKWKIVDMCSDVLNKNGEWEFEPSPSSRDAAFIERTRYASVADAAATIAANGISSQADSSKEAR